VEAESLPTQRKKLISLVQFSGPAAKGRIQLMSKLGLLDQIMRFRVPMFPRTPLGTYHYLTQILEEYTAWPAKRDWLNTFSIWVDGLVDCKARDILRGSTFSDHLFRLAYEQTIQILDSTRQIFFVSLERKRIPQDAGVVSRYAKLREEYQRVADLLVEWGADVYVCESFEETWVAEKIRWLVRKQHITGYGHEISDGRIGIGGGV